MVIEEFNFFKNLLMEGHDEKLKNFAKSNKKCVIFTSYTNFSKKKLQLPINFP